ncbi:MULTISPECIES: T3SS effector HopA1 family protein [unclassified Streptomyces]|uniref:T3SS effector HopA1 family protein n=1 Tax=unclassified Streptomyces TaxID=2593676 RepID=UPI00274148EE|nr:MULTISPECIES: T3SS effector HopA1 family protein [unclassified Streptomyces]
MITVADTFPPALARAIEGIEVAPDGLSAVLGDEHLSADSPHKLAQQLGAAVYQMVHVGRDRPETSRPRTLRDPELDRALAEAMPHTTTSTRVVVQERAADGTLLAVVEGLRVLLPADVLAEPVPDILPAGVLARLPAARPALSTGFFLADGSAGTGVGSGPQTLRVYVHVASPEAAPGVWHAVLSYLEEGGVPYRAKITSSPRMFPRRDALVVYLGPQGRHAVSGLAARAAELPGLGTDVSPFAHRLAPGVALAWEPDDGRPGMRALSFGEHRSGALAEALVKHAVRTDGVGRTATIEETFMNAGIDPMAPALNLGSPPLPGVGLFQ